MVLSGCRALLAAWGGWGLPGWVAAAMFQPAVVLHMAMSSSSCFAGCAGGRRGRLHLGDDRTSAECGAAWLAVLSAERLGLGGVSAELEVRTGRPWRVCCRTGSWAHRLSLVRRCYGA